MFGWVGWCSEVCSFDLCVCVCALCVLCVCFVLCVCVRAGGAVCVFCGVCACALSEERGVGVEGRSRWDAYL